MSLALFYFYYISRSYVYKTDRELNFLEHEDDRDESGDSTTFSPVFLLKLHQHQMQEQAKTAAADSDAAEEGEL